jgi:hypothetical protein
MTNRGYGCFNHPEIGDSIGLDGIQCVIIGNIEIGNFLFFIPKGYYMMQPEALRNRGTEPLSTIIF